MHKLFHLTHSPIECYFHPSVRDFVVREIPLYEASGAGEHLMIFVRKKELSTFEMVEILSNVLGIKSAQIGYAGLKDKHATTYQYLSIPRAFESRLSACSTILNERGIKVLECRVHTNKLRVGHLKGNNFFMRLKKLTPIEAQKAINALEILKVSGFANYFGNQRFGKDGQNYQEGEKILENLRITRDKKIARFLLSAYQSHLFNLWLLERMRLNKMIESCSPRELVSSAGGYGVLDSVLCDERVVRELKAQEQFFKLLRGDVAVHYPYGKAFVLDDVRAESTRFIQRQISPSGALCGKKLLSAQDVALEIERVFVDSRLREVGSRRYAWVWAQDVAYTYKPEVAQMELSFSLPKGSYATIFLETLKNAHH